MEVEPLLMQLIGEFKESMIQDIGESLESLIEKNYWGVKRAEELSNGDMQLTSEFLERLLADFEREA